MLERLRRVLEYRISIAALIEVWLWVAGAYFTVGLVWSGFNPVYAQQIEVHFLSGLPAGNELIAFMDSALLWPVLVLAPGICPT